MRAQAPAQDVLQTLLIMLTLAVFALTAPPSFAAGRGILVREADAGVVVTWPIKPGESGEAIFNLADASPLITSLSITSPDGARRQIATELNPVTLLTIGSRDLKPSGWTAFFDNPPLRPSQTVPIVLGQRHLKVSGDENRMTVRLAKAAGGTFSGEIRVTFYRDSPLLHLETILSTPEDGRAYFYDTGLTSARPEWEATVWRDTEGNAQRRKLEANAEAASIAVRGRALAVEGLSGSAAVFPAPHQFFYPQDEAFNLKFVWYGKNYADAVRDCGFGIRQSFSGDKRYVPWYNAPPNTEQHLGVFYLLSSGDGVGALDAVAKYTHGDRFKKLPGYLTFTSHYHIEHTLEYMRKQREQKTDQVPQGLEVPGLVKTFKARGVDIVHLAEFHNGNTPTLGDQERLAQLQILHAECERLSDEQLLVLPGEEPNVHLGGHWLSLFPKPVLWVLNRTAEQPFEQEIPGVGHVYHVGSAEDVLQLMEKEKGLMWTAHPRIKASLGFPDKYKDAAFFRSERFLGAAWKAMPADLSRPTLGWRVLDLLDDELNWGLHKQALGEADLFRMEPDFETYAHMNINYLQLDRLPKFNEGWQPVLDVLRAGRFFVSTGEVLIPKFTVGGRASGETLELGQESKANLEATLEWTFPMAFAQIVSGDGAQVFKQRIDLSDTGSFGTRILRVPVELKGRTWVRLEAWDIAANGAFTQPISLTSGKATSGGAAAAKPAERSTWARFVPERKDDFAWENDLVAFRVYGPAIRPPGTPAPDSEDSGIDCWNKRVPYPIIDKWYAGEQHGVSYHEDHGEGNDLYKVGSSRGCGGTAIWKKGRMWISGPYQGWKLISRDPKKTVFELTYAYDVDGEKYQEVKRITIELGMRLFRSESTFTQDGKPAALDVAIGITTHEGKAKPFLNPAEGWMSCWEKIEGFGHGTGVVIDPARVVEMREFKDAGSTQAHALLIARTDGSGKVTHYAGFGWEKAGAITNPDQWQEYLSKSRAGLNLTQ